MCLSEKYSWTYPKAAPPPPPPLLLSPLSWIASLKFYISLTVYDLDLVVKDDQHSSEWAAEQVSGIEDGPQRIHNKHLTNIWS